jgi:hypothetical protein
MPLTRPSTRGRQGTAVATLLAFLALIATALVLAPGSAQAMDDAGGGTDACVPMPGFPGFGTDGDGFCDPLEESGGGGAGGDGGGGDGGEGAGGDGGTGSGDGGVPPEVIVFEGWGPAPSEPVPPPQAEPPPRGSGPEFGFPEPPRRGSGAKPPKKTKPTPVEECLKLAKEAGLNSDEDKLERLKAQLERLEEERLRLRGMILAADRTVEEMPDEPSLKREIRHKYHMVRDLSGLERKVAAMEKAKKEWDAKKCEDILSPTTKPR